MGPRKALLWDRLIGIPIRFFELDITDIGDSILDPATISLTIDGNDVTPGLTVTKEGSVTTIRHDQDPQWLFDETLDFEFIAEDTIGQLIERESNFTVPGADISVATGLTSVEFTVTDQGTSVLQPGTIVVMINDVDVTADLTINKVGDVTTIRHDEDPQFAFGSTVTYSFAAMDGLGQDMEASGQFDVAEPYFPAFGEELIGAEEMAVDGNWGVRYIWGAEELLDLETVLDVIEQAGNDPDNFIGTIVDTSEPFMNHSDDLARHMAQPDQPYHADAVNAGLPADDFILYGVGCMQISEPGDYTIGVHSDDGFGLRVHGFTFTESFGGDGRDPRNGTIDPFSSDTVIHPSVTGDTNTRAVATNVQPGIYRIEFCWWERGGGDHGEIYIAKGRFPNDADTADWKLIGSTEPGGVPLVSKSEDFRITEFIYDEENDTFTLTWSSRDDEIYGVYWDTDLRTFGSDVVDDIKSQGDFTSHGPFDNPSPGSDRLFFRIQKN